MILLLSYSFIPINIFVIFFLIFLYLYLFTFALFAEGSIRCRNGFLYGCFLTQ